MVQSGSNGLLVEKTEPQDLAVALDAFLNETFIFNREVIAAAARTKYSPEVQASTYISLYESLPVK
jgi:glycosyltransferase involved in cell wall biosynthesis